MTISEARMTQFLVDKKRKMPHCADSSQIFHSINSSFNLLIHFPLPIVAVIFQTQFAKTTWSICFLILLAKRNKMHPLKLKTWSVRRKIHHFFWQVQVYDFSFISGVCLKPLVPPIRIEIDECASALKMRKTHQKIVGNGWIGFLRTPDSDKLTNVEKPLNFRPNWLRLNFRKRLLKP